ncbi:lys-63-specific deubiquitinase BRCC36 isoform X1 [Dryobates pubescens]|uniref:lys-63-specific deubiquitinase BRCC36 isoform X1 n=1 Tax=Dryobates pubescens TaxID=118200 RepID=UPI0023B98B27|nr:lys-63-specific deubiquitinase BRCC36 isoform X1 [Dryobates pubescens]
MLTDQPGLSSSLGREGLALVGSKETERQKAMDRVWEEPRRRKGRTRKGWWEPGLVKSRRRSGCGGRDGPGGQGEQVGEGVCNQCGRRADCRGEEAGRAGEARPPRRKEGAARLHSNYLPPGTGLRGSAAGPRRETAPGGAGGAQPGPSGRPPATYLQPRARLTPVESCTSTLSSSCAARIREKTVWKSPQSSFQLLLLRQRYPLEETAAAWPAKWFPSDLFLSAFL